MLTQNILSKIELIRSSKQTFFSLQHNFLPIFLFSEHFQWCNQDEDEKSRISTTKTESIRIHVLRVISISHISRSLYIFYSLSVLNSPNIIFILIHQSLCSKQYRIIRFIVNFQTSSHWFFCVCSIEEGVSYPIGEKSINKDEFKCDFLNIYERNVFSYVKLMVSCGEISLRSK